MTRPNSSILDETIRDYFHGASGLRYLMNLFDDSRQDAPIRYNDNLSPFDRFANWLRQRGGFPAGRLGRCHLECILALYKQKVSSPRPTPPSGTP